MVSGWGYRIPQKCGSGHMAEMFCYFVGHLDLSQRQESIFQTQGPKIIYWNLLYKGKESLRIKKNKILKGLNYHGYLTCLPWSLGPHICTFFQMPKFLKYSILIRRFSVFFPYHRSLPSFYNSVNLF